MTPPEILELVQAYAEGATLRELTQQFGIHRSTVQNHLRRHQIEPRPPVRKLTDQDVKEAARLYDSGLSTTQLGHRFQVDPATINRALRRAGVALRGRSPAVPAQC